MDEDTHVAKGRDGLRSNGHMPAEQDLNSGLLIEGSVCCLCVEPTDHDSDTTCMKQCAYVGSRFYGKSITTGSKIKATVPRYFKLWQDFNCAE